MPKSIFILLIAIVFCLVIFDIHCSRCQSLIGCNCLIVIMVVNFLGDVYIHPSAVVHPTAVVRCVSTISARLGI